jgi:hypothetical protein
LDRAAVALAVQVPVTTVLRVVRMAAAVVVVVVVTAV